MVTDVSCRNPQLWLENLVTGQLIFIHLKNLAFMEERCGQKKPISKSIFNPMCSNNKKTNRCE